MIRESNVVGVKHIDAAGAFGESKYLPVKAEADHL
jgi:hypothetical protein